MGCGGWAAKWHPWRGSWLGLPAGVGPVLGSRRQLPLSQGNAGSALVAGEEDEGFSGSRVVLARSTAHLGFLLPPWPGPWAASPVAFVIPHPATCRATSGGHFPSLTPSPQDEWTHILLGQRGRTGAVSNGGLGSEPGSAAEASWRRVQGLSCPCSCLQELFTRSTEHRGAGRVSCPPNPGLGQADILGIPSVYASYPSIS